MSPRVKRKPNLEQPLLLTIPETATQLRVTEPTVYAYIADGTLPAIDIARPGSKTTHLRVPWDDLKQFVATRPRVHDKTP